MIPWTYFIRLKPRKYFSRGKLLRYRINACTSVGVRLGSQRDDVFIRSKTRANTRRTKIFSRPLGGNGFRTVKNHRFVLRVTAVFSIFYRIHNLNDRPRLEAIRRAGRTHSYPRPERSVPFNYVNTNYIRCLQYNEFPPSVRDYVT